VRSSRKPKRTQERKSPAGKAGLFYCILIAVIETIRPLIAQGKYGDAIPLLRQVLTETPQNAEAHFFLAQSLYLTGEPIEAALHHFAAAQQAGFDPARVSLYRGILHAECGDYSAAAADFEIATDEHLLKQTLRNQAGVGSCRDLYYPPPHLPHLDANWLETCSIPQSMQFMIDCLPAIRALIAGCEELEVLDVGTASAAGPALLSQLHSGRFFGPHLRIDAIDLIRRYQAYARRAFPLVHYICGDLFQYDPARRWDLVLCSHTIEHLTDPTPLIQHCRQRARKWALFYAPFEEKHLIPGHLRSITRDYVESLNPVRMEVLTSPAWQHPTDPESKTILFVLEGQVP
jgi:SAM-dependent methyltransferase